MPDWDDDLPENDEERELPELDPELKEELERVSLGGDTEEWEPPGAEDSGEPAPEGTAQEEPADEEPVAEEPAAEEPADEEPAAEEPADEAPLAEEPAGEEAAEEPALDEPAAEEPAAGEADDPGDDQAEAESPGEDDKPRRTVVIGAAPTSPPEAAPAPATPAAKSAGAPGPAAATGTEAPPAEGALPAGMTPLDVGGADAVGESPPGSRLWLRFLSASFVIVVSFAAATSVSLLLYLSDIAAGLGRGADLRGVKHQLTNVDGGKPQTILIVGSDIRPQDRRIGRRGLSDTTMLLRLDPDRNAIPLLSIPRDLKVNIPGVGVAKFNEAYAQGGPRLTLRVVRQLTGLEVNHLVNVDFTGFLKAVNAINCVYIDVDRRYYHSNIGVPAALQYAFINIAAGYQRMCGNNALAYVRYRHTDTDIVRAARQHDFLREARAKVSPTKLFSDRKTLLRIFTDYTSSDIDDPSTMLQVLKLFLASRNAPIQEVSFPARIGRSYVTSSAARIRRAVAEFLGFQATKGPRGKLPARLRNTDEGVRPGGSGKSEKAKKKAKKRKNVVNAAASGLEETSYGRDLAFGAQRKLRFPVFYPTQVVAGSIFDQAPRPYTIIGPGDEPYRAYRYVMKTPQGDYYGLQGTTWKDPPILEKPSETIRAAGRNYQLFYDGDRVRLVAWRTQHGSYWVMNSLLETLTRNQMLGIAETVERTRPQRKRNRGGK